MENIIRVYDKNRQPLAEFSSYSSSLTDKEKLDMMVNPTVHIETNGESSLTFQMLATSEKWKQIKHPENIYVVNGREYTALNDGSIVYSDNNGVSIVTVKICETWYLLNKKYSQIYNCGIYSVAKAHFQNMTTDGAIFKIYANECQNLGNTISGKNAWTQVKNWETQDDDNEYLSYAILRSDEYTPTNWEDTPQAVFFQNIQVVESNNGWENDYALITIKPRGNNLAQENFDYSDSNSYTLAASPLPTSLLDVYIISTTVVKSETETTYTTSTKQISSYNYANGTLSINYTPTANETISTVFCRYYFNDLGTISPGATCYFAYGAEVVDEHTVAILPKAKTKYKLTINGVEYDDSEVKDGRGEIQPRGSAGYALWAILHDTDWKLGICDVIAKGFDTSIDYGCFNIESDMQDALYNIQYVQQLYGGILDWDSANKVLNFRAENSEDYQAYEDGFNDWTGYEFRAGKNLLSQPEITIDNSLVTKAYILGYGNLNIKKVNDGKSYLTDFSYTDTEYVGYLEQSLIYDTNDDSGMKQLMYWGQKELAKQCRPRIKISAEVTDIRYQPEYEHEIFDINNIVRLYYIDTETFDETYEQKRITQWEYNVFAPFECSIVIGDKTQNLAEIFKLIYNKAVNDAPSTDASGMISASDLAITMPNSFAADWGYSGGYGGGGLENNLEDYLELLVETATDNSDALAGLIMRTDELSAQTQLFSQYQKQTDNLFSQTYAGLTTYADEKVAALELIAQGQWKSLKGDISTTNKALAGFKAEVANTYATTTQLSNFQTQVGEQFTSTESSLKTYADEAVASLELTAQGHWESLEDKITNTEASIKVWAQQNFASIQLEAWVGNNGSVVNVTSNGTSIFAQGSSAAYFNVTTAGGIGITANNVVSILSGGNFNVTATGGGITIGTTYTSWAEMTSRVAVFG